MTTDILNRQAAAELFLRMLIARAYDEVIEGMVLDLNQGPPGRQPPRDFVLLHQWFQTLDNENRECVQLLIQKVAESTVFGCLVLLDGLTGGYPVKDKLSDFALYLQIYQEKSARISDSPQVSVRLNPAGTADEDLHDMFLGILQERAKHNE